MVTGVDPSPPRFLPSIFIAHRVQQSHCSSIFHRVLLLTHALALSASQFVYKTKSPRIYTSMHSAGLELTKLIYTRLEGNLIRHRGDRHSVTHWHPAPGSVRKLQQQYREYREYSSIASTAVSRVQQYREYSSIASTAAMSTCQRFVLKAITSIRKRKIQQLGSYIAIGVLWGLSPYQAMLWCHTPINTPAWKRCTGDLWRLIWFFMTRHAGGTSDRVHHAGSAVSRPATIATAAGLLH